MLNKFRDRILAGWNGVLQSTTDAWNRFQDLGTRDAANEDPNIMASAATIAPQYKYTRVSGTAAIATITPPWNGFAGTIVLFPTGIWTWTTGGNIQIAGTVTAGNHVPVEFTYLPALGKWVPSRLA